MNRWRVRLLAFAGLCSVGTLMYLTRADRTPEADPEGLHTDDRVRRLAPYDIAAATVATWSPLDIPPLGVVPAGATRPRREVFEALGLDEHRVRDLRASPSFRVTILRWQVSPSYDVVCMTADNSPASSAVPLDDPERSVYGIRFVSRSEGAHHIW